MKHLIHLAVLSFALSAFAAPSSNQPPSNAPTTGYLDPTASTANSSHPMRACSSSCSTALINQNTDAMQWAIDQAASTSPHPVIYLPAGEYPIGRGGASHNQLYGLKLNNQSHVVIRGYGATLRASGDLGAGTYFMLEAWGGSSDIRIYGVMFSQRDLTHSPIPEQTHMIQWGDGATGVDDIQVVDCAFTDGQGGDAFRMLGGTTQANAVSRVSIFSSWINGKRSGISVQHGTAMINAVSNFLGPDCTDQELDHEATSFGGNNEENYVGNFFYRPTDKAAQLITLGGTSAGDKLAESAFDVDFSYNIVPNGDVYGLNMYRTWLAHNIINTQVTGTIPVIDLFRVAEDTWITDNWLAQNSQTYLATGASTAITLTNSGGWYPSGAWIRGNTIEETTQASTAISMFPAREFWISHNAITYRNATANNFVGVNAIAAGGLGNDGLPMIASGVIANNIIRKGKQADNVTAAGTMLKGVQVGINAPSSTVGGHFIVRGNLVDGASTPVSNVTSSGTNAEGVPLISGNQGASASSIAVSAPFVTETTQDAERITGNAALSPSRRVSMIAGSCANDTDTLGDGVYDGEIKTVQVHAGCTSSGTLTLSSFGDGSSISWTVDNVTPTAQFRMAWDAANSTWWMLDKSSAVTVNP